LGRWQQHTIGLSIWFVVTGLQVLVFGFPGWIPPRNEECSSPRLAPQSTVPPQPVAPDSTSMPYPPGYTVGGPLGEPKFGPAITKADAIRLAEQFVADNGFTTAIPNRPKLRFDIADFGSVDEVLARRHNTLRPTAYGYTREYRGQGKGWTIVFRHREGGDWGMAVTMYPDGTDIHAMHLGFSLRYCKRLP
jgi:hypothetical protein